MGLTPADRGILDQLLDQSINNVKSNLKLFNNDLTKQWFQLNNVKEFVFGIEYGTITRAYSNYFGSIYSRITTPEEADEIIQVILKRLPEIKKAICFSE